METKTVKKVSNNYIVHCNNDVETEQVLVSVGRITTDVYWEYVCLKENHYSFFEEIKDAIKYFEGAKYTLISFNCWENNIKSKTEMKKEFVLPNKWCIKITKDNLETIGNYYNRQGSSVYTNNEMIGRYYSSHNLSSQKSVMNDDDYGSNFSFRSGNSYQYTEISFEQFKKYVLKPETMKKQTLTREQLIGLKSVSDCDTWNNTINHILNTNMFNVNNDFEIPQSALDLLMKDGSSYQKNVVTNLGIVLPKSKEEKYLENHNKSGIAIGDKVKLTRIAQSNENGWGRMWNKEMDKLVGKVLTITSDEKSYGFEAFDSETNNEWLFPYFVLEKVIKEYIPFDFTDDLLGKIINSKNKLKKGIITFQNDEFITLGDLYVNYNELFEGFTFLDGTPCGKIKE